MTKDQVRSTEEALDLALEALAKISRTHYHIETPPIESLEEKMRRIADKAITAIKQARSAQQEPVNQRAHEMALRQWDHWKQYALELHEKLVKYEGGAPMVLNTTPPAAQRQWVWLTDEDIEQEFGFIDELLRDCVHRTEAKVREKNNG